MKEISNEHYRKIQIAAVTGFSGGSVFEIQLVTSVYLFSLLLWISIQSHMTKDLRLTSRFFIEFIVFVIPQIVSFTYTDWTLSICASAFVFACIFFIWSVKKESKVVVGICHFNSKEALNRFTNEKFKYFLVQTRSSVMTMTIISILAVDFNIYPRRFVKTEVFGTSLMDVGVGCVVFMNAIIAARYFTLKSPERISFSPKVLFSNLFKALKSSSPLILIGLIRLASVKSLEYQEHFSEYGVHWNFFFTLSAIPVIVSVISSVFPVNYFGIIAAAISISYQFALTFVPGLGEFILSDAREMNNFISMNKEGLFSLFGYTSLFLFGVWIGQYFFNNQSKELSYWKSHLLKLMFGISIAFWIAYSMAVNIFGIEASRRQLNLSSVLWFSAFTTTHTSINLLLDLYFGISAYKKGSFISTAINRNQLFLFLFSNLLTGFINLNMRTLLVSDFIGFLVILFYMFVVCGIAAFLECLNITLKFW